MLEEEHGFEIESVSHKGDTVEDMAYSGEQFDEFTKLLEKLLKQEHVPDAILLSGGGNDIAGDEFAILLNHAASGLPPLNDDVVRGVIDVRVRNAYAYLIGGLTEIARRYLDRPIPILSTATTTRSRTVAACSADSPSSPGPGCGRVSIAKGTAIRRPIRRQWCD